MDDPKIWLALARAPGLHAGHLRAAAGAAIPPQALSRESSAALARFGIGERAAAALRNPDPAGLAADERWLASPGRRLVNWGSPDYPALLVDLPDPPAVLYVDGDAAVLGLPQLAVVGSRNPTALGRDTATQFARHLAASGLAITSGLALGIDAAAHRGVAVDVQHRGRVRQVGEQGRVVGRTPVDQSTPRRGEPAPVGRESGGVRVAERRGGALADAESRQRVGRFPGQRLRRYRGAGRGAQVSGMQAGRPCQRQPDFRVVHGRGAYRVRTRQAPVESVAFARVSGRSRSGPSCRGRNRGA